MKENILYCIINTMEYYIINYHKRCTSLINDYLPNVCFTVGSLSLSNQLEPTFDSLEDYQYIKFSKHAYVLGDLDYSHLYHFIFPCRVKKVLSSLRYNDIMLTSDQGTLVDQIKEREGKRER